MTDHPASNMPKNRPAEAVPDNAVACAEAAAGAGGGLGAKAIMAVGYGLSWAGSIMARQVVSILAKEDVSAYAFAKEETLFGGIKKGFARTFDPKLWKSSLAEWGVLFSGMLLTDVVVKHHGQRQSAAKHVATPRIRQENQLLDGEGSANRQTSQTPWQDMLQKKEMPPQPGRTA